MSMLCQKLIDLNTFKSLAFGINGWILVRFTPYNKIGSFYKQ